MTLNVTLSRVFGSLETARVRFDIFVSLLCSSTSPSVSVKLKGCGQLIFLVSIIEEGVGSQFEREEWEWLECSRMNDSFTLATNSSRR